MSKIHITQGRIIDPANQSDRAGEIYISNDRIVSLTDRPSGFVADIIIDAHNQIVCPGFIDMSARLREPGASQKATIQSETLAAAAAGVTSLCLPPDTNPFIDNSAVAELIYDKADQANYQQIFPIAALTYKLQGLELSSMYALKQSGCIAVSNAQMPMSNLLVLRRAMEYATSFDLLMIYRPQDYHLANHGCIHEGSVATKYGLPGIPETAETIALIQCLELVQQTGCKVHFNQISCARSVNLLKQAKKQGLPVSADVAIHQLHLTDQDVDPFDSVYHVNPPFRTEKDRQALIEAVRDGVIDVICSDHQPHNIDAKLGAFPETEPGISSLETVLPLMLRLVNEGHMDLMQGIATLTRNPARVLDLNSGSLAEGELADICVFDSELNWKIADESWKSKGRNTPYWGKNMQGKVTHTLQYGRLIYRT